MKYDAELSSANVQAFLRMLRVGEGTSDQDGYRRHFGGELFDSFADHPRRAITKPLGERTITSTAAGAYQFLASTWDECAKALGLQDFSPASQDRAAVFLIDRRRALQDVLNGHIEEAIRKCNREWASLPGSPYGQPTRTLAQAMQIYSQFLAKPSEKPMTPIVAALLPTLLEKLDISKLFDVFKKGPDRNEKVATMLFDVAKTTLQAANEQEAIERMEQDPTAVVAVRKAVEEQWFTIVEVGGGVAAAHKRNLETMAAGTALWKNPAFVISMIFMVFPTMLFVDVFYVHPEAYAGELRTQIITAVLAVIMMVGGYWIGTSYSSAKKDERAQ